MIYLYAIFLNLFCLISPVFAKPFLDHQVSFDDIPIVPHHVLIKNMIQQHDRFSQKDYMLFSSIYQKKHAMFPRIEWVYMRARMGYEFPDVFKGNQIVDFFDFLRENPYFLGKKDMLKTKWGNMSYQYFHLRAAPCVMFSHDWKGGKIGGGVQIIAYFCAQKGGILSHSQVLSFLTKFQVRQYLPSITEPKAVSYDFPLFFFWGRDKAFKGEGLVHVLSDRKGKMRFSVKNVQCKGSFFAKKGINSPQIKTFGRWAVECSNGSHIKGKYMLKAHEVFEGIGYDDQGQMVSFTSQP